MSSLNPEDVPAALAELQPFMTECCETQLCDWAENANSGCWVKMRLPGPEHLEIYRGKDRAGRTQRWGQRYTMILIELHEHTDEPINHDQRRRMEPQKESKPMSIVQKAGYLCTLEDFRQWLRETYNAEVNSVETAAIFVRDWCKVESRRELLTNEEAAKIFRDMENEFEAWRVARVADNG